ncbi:hypothetical protein Trydic_g3534 [Trypoxylus dichotomus]
MRKKNLQEKYQSVQRKLTIRITGGYRTASSEVLFMLAWTSPIDFWCKRGVKLSREVAEADKVSMIPCSTEGTIDGAAILGVLYGPKY